MNITELSPTQLSEEMRTSDHPDMVRRRWIIGLSMIGSTMAQIVSMYQTGILKGLPDPPLPGFDSDRVDASEYAYSRLQTADGFMMLANYAITGWLAGAGGANRAQQNPLLPIAMSAKTMIDTVASLELAREEWSENKAFCAYCQVATLCSAASVVLSLPEAMTAVQVLLDRNQSKTSS
ncbi:vitamin K epoxide reductase family protein [Leptolyngbya sp. FACHB-711]|jgi:hypothetical protein|uniref:vitamin K epoxide reductase family protein n=1 Tax=unclassified Leptolyngbya TaxID=2650499 RepID=UPI001688253F|nr:vitamin K epoxide reductase family protein [Leptolyngbya sp. FACHB-711]MBD1849993.1 vitamin K epoxide reductase family protein [Cyanobacteria bacterium FACHB-502]MBD2027488.1 vitamin K epoxide reductase family protein [Leptolyngbya sp. FACHB-711]